LKRNLNEHRKLSLVVTHSKVTLNNNNSSKYEKNISNFTINVFAKWSSIYDVSFFCTSYFAFISVDIDLEKSGDMNYNYYHSEAFLGCRENN
jgi:hypothetical protein